MAADEEIVVSANRIQISTEHTKLSVGNIKQTLTLEILPIIKDAQMQHGLRHGDYQRYRSYCTRRLRRLRKTLHFMQGNRHRFQGKKITEEMLRDVKYLYIPLVMAERAWSFAMQLKQEANTELRKRFHLMGRMQKAAKHTEELERLCESNKCDARTKLEAQAYAAWMKGTLQFELQQWQFAMDDFEKALTIYEKLSSALSEEEQILYHQRIDEIKPNIRYCSYNIGDQSAINDLKQMRRAVGEDILASKLDALIAQTREKQAATLSEVSWRGRTIPVKHEKVRVFLLNVQESEHEVQRANTLESKISVYESLLMECKDAIQVLRDELKNDPNFKLKTIEGPISSLHFLHSYVVYIRLSKTIERNLLMIRGVKQQQMGSGDRAPDAKKANKPQELIRLYETIVQNYSEILQLPGVSEDTEFTQTLVARITAFKALRSYNIAQLFATNKKWLEAIALYERVQAYCKQALQNKNLLEKDLTCEVEDILKAVEGQKYSAHALSILGTDDVPEQTEKVTAIVKKKPLYERLDEYYEDQNLVSKQPNIAPFPPDFKAVACKPLFFDLALNHVEFPSFNDRVEQKKGVGLTGMVKGWLWGGGNKK
uniref:Signal recognition particle subunit SRP68 n=1 Tax=Strigamia maritima TaxID=126957 RepID=T1J1Y0_STRMM